jgi:hypothetical protein
MASKKRDKKTFEKLKKKCNSKLTDIVGGPMALDKISQELSNLELHRSPEYVIILLEKRLDLKKKYDLKEDYHGAIYITGRDFKKYF